MTGDAPRARVLAAVGSGVVGIALAAAWVLRRIDGKDAAVAVRPWAEELALWKVLELAVGVAAAAVVARVTAAGTVLRQASQPPVSPPAAGSQVCPVDTRTEWSRWYSTLPGTL